MPHAHLYTMCVQNRILWLCITNAMTAYRWYTIFFPDHFIFGYCTVPSLFLLWQWMLLPLPQYSLLDFLRLISAECMAKKNTAIRDQPPVASFFHLLAGVLCVLLYCAVYAACSQLLLSSIYTSVYIIHIHTHEYIAGIVAGCRCCMVERYSRAPDLFNRF